jgi:hypothetical protein
MITTAPRRSRRNRRSRQPSLTAVSDGTDIFLVLGNRQIAKRGRPGTQHAKQWIPLEPGVVVRDDPYPTQITVEINGVCVH